MALGGRKLSIDEVIEQLRGNKRFRLKEPSGIPKVLDRHRLPEDVERFYTLCGGLECFLDYPEEYTPDGAGPMPIRILSRKRLFMLTCPSSERNMKMKFNPTGIWLQMPIMEIIFTGWMKRMLWGRLRGTGMRTTTIKTYYGRPSERGGSFVCGGYHKTADRGEGRG